MTFEAIIIIAVAVVFIVLVRRIPDEPAENITKVSMPKGDFKFKFPKIKVPKFNLKLKSSVGKKQAEKIKDNFDPFVEPEQKEAKQEFTSEMLQPADDLLASGDIDKAEKEYLRLASKYPGELKIFNRLGVVYLKQKNYSDARDSFLQALKIDDTEASRHYNLAMAYIGMGVVEKAKVSIKKAIELDGSKKKYKDTLDKIEKKSS